MKIKPSDWQKAKTLPIERFGNSTWKNQQHFNNLFGSAGRTSGGTITDAGGETIDVAAGTGWIKKTDDDTAELIPCDWDASSGISVATNSTLYVGVKYTSGTDTVAVDTRATQDWDYDTNFPLGSVINLNGVLYILNNPWWITDGLTNLVEKSVGLGGYLARDQFVGGLLLGVTGTRNPTMTAGTVWGRTTEFEMTEIDYSTPTGTFNTYWFESDGTVHETTGLTAYPVDQWNDIDNDQITNFTPNRYGVWWVFLNVTNNELAFIYPSAEYANTALAEAEELPSHIPGDWYLEGLIIGRVIIKQGQDAPVEVQSAFTTTFTAAQAADHGNLGGLSDDDHSQYALLAGRATGQTLIGDTASGGDLTLQSTSHATRGTVLSIDNVTIGDGSAVNRVLTFDTANTDGTITYNNSASQFYFNTTIQAQASVTVANNVNVLGFGEVRLWDNGTNYVGFEAPALTANQIWVLPSADGNANEALGTDAGGNLIWRTHDELAGFVANEHIDHTSVTLTAGAGLSGGGDISSNRTFALDINELDAVAIASGDEIAYADVSDSNNPKKVTFANFEGAIDHGNLTGLDTGADHSYIDQDVTSGSSPTFDGANFTGIPDAAMDTDYVEVAGDTMTGLLTMDQDADAIGINIDSEASTVTNYGLQVVTGQGAGAAFFSYGAAANGAFYAALPPNGGYIGSFGFTRDLAAAATDCSLVYIHQDNAGDDTAALEIVQDGSGDALLATGTVDITGAVGITGALTATSYGGITEANLVDKSASETIAGEWTFGVFPITPSAAPDANYEVANKKYVDDELAGVAGHAILDGAVHTDSVAQDVTRGSLIYGNATPKWDELVVGAADTFLGADGTDVSWRTAAQVLASLSGEAGAAFDWNAQNLSNIGTVGCGEITVADGSSINLQEAITFTGATTENLIEIPDSLAVALAVKEGANSYLTFVSSDGSEKIEFGHKLDMGDNEIEDVKSLVFNDGGATVDIIRDEDAMGSDDENALATQQSIKAYVDSVAGGANTALSNLAAVAINTSLVSDTDVTDDLGTGDVRWNDAWIATISSGLTATDTLKLRGRDVDGSVYVDVLTITSANTVTADLNAITTIGGNAIAYAGGAFHDGFSDFVANEHIDWTSASSNFSTSGSHTILSDNGTDIGAAGDTDADLITVNVTGAPKFWWDESEDLFTISKGLELPSISLASTAITSTAAEINITDGGQTTEKVLNVQCKARAYDNANQSINTGTYTLCTFDQETYDVGSDFDTTTYQFTTPVAGYYLVIGQIQFDIDTDGKVIRANIYVDGTNVALGQNHTSSTSNNSVGVSDIIYVAASKTIDLRAWHNQGGAKEIIGSSLYTWFSVHLLSI